MFFYKVKQKKLEKKSCFDIIELSIYRNNRRYNKLRTNIKDFLVLIYILRPNFCDFNIVGLSFGPKYCTCIQ